MVCKQILYGFDSVLNVTMQQAIGLYIYKNVSLMRSCIFDKTISNFANEKTEKIACVTHGIKLSVHI